MKLVWISILGLTGVLARYATTEIGKRLIPIDFPWGTLAANLLGSFLIGMIYVWGIERQEISETLRTAIIIGFLGGFTTMSSYSMDVIRFVDSQQYIRAALYGLGTPAICLCLTMLGVLLTRKI